MAEFHFKFHHTIFFSKQQNKLILAINLLISKHWVVLITSVASMTSTASLATKLDFACTLHTVWFPLNKKPLQSQWPLQPHFIKRLTQLDAFIHPGTKMTCNVVSMLDGSSKTHNIFLLIFGNLSVWGCGGHGFYF